MKYTGKALRLDGETLKQVNKKSARAAYNVGKTVWLHPNNMCFINPWQSPMPVARGCDMTFDAVVNSFEANTPRELGTYANFFIKI